MNKSVIKSRDLFRAKSTTERLSVVHKILQLVKHIASTCLFWHDPNLNEWEKELNYSYLHKVKSLYSLQKQSRIKVYAASRLLNSLVIYLPCIGIILILLFRKKVQQSFDKYKLCLT